MAKKLIAPQKAPRLEELAKEEDTKHEKTPTQKGRHYFEQAVHVPLIIIIISFLHVLALYALWNHLETHYEELDEMLVFAWDPVTGLAIGWHSLAMLSTAVYVAIWTEAIAVFLILFLRFIPLAAKMDHAIKEKLYHVLYFFLGSTPLMVSALVSYMYFVGIACKRYSAFVLLIFMIAILALIIFTIMKIVKTFKQRTHRSV